MTNNSSILIGASITTYDYERYSRQTSESASTQKALSKYKIVIDEGCSVV